MNTPSNQDPAPQDSNHLEENIYLSIHGTLALNPFQLLNLQPGATEAEITQAYQTAIAEFPQESHPEKFAQLTAAHTFLTSPETKHAVAMGPLPLRKPRSFFK